MGWLRNLFRVKWVVRLPGRWEACGECEGACEIDLSSRRPIGPREQNANAVECPGCHGMGRNWRPL